MGGTEAPGWRRGGNKAVRWHMTLWLLHTPPILFPAALAKKTAHLFGIRWIVSRAVLPSRADTPGAVVAGRSDPAMERTWSEITLHPFTVDYHRQRTTCSIARRRRL